MTVQPEVGRSEEKKVESTAAAMDPTAPVEEERKKSRKGKVRRRKRTPQKPGVSRTQRRKAKKKAREEALTHSVQEQLSAVQHDSSELIIVSAMLDGRHCGDVLIDPGATSNFVQKQWAEEGAMPMQKLSRPLEITLGDGKKKEGGGLTHAVEVTVLSTQGSEAPCTLTVMNELSHQIIIGMPWLRKAGVILDFKNMTWNDRQLYPFGEQKGRGPARLQSLQVAPEHEKRMGALLAQYPLAFSTDLRARTAAEVEKAVKCRFQLKDPSCRPVKSRERRRSPKDVATLKAISGGDDGQGADCAQRE